MNRRALALGAALLSLACTDAFFFEPPTNRADFAVSFDLIAVPQFSSHGLETAFDRADAARVVLSRLGGEVVLDATVDFDPADPVVQLESSIEVPEEGETFELVGELLADAEIVFRGTTTMVLFPERGITSEIPILPVSVDILAPASVTFDALADTMTIPVMGLFSTGDTIPEVAVAWTVIDPNVARPTAGGLVSRAEGSTLAIAQSGESADTVEVIVAPVVTSVDVQPDIVNADVDIEINYTATAFDRKGNALERSVMWSIDDSGVATISATGLLVTLEEGDATVSARVDGVTGVGTLTVSRDVPDVATVTVDPASAQILIDESRTFQAIARDAMGAQLTGRPVTWTSSAPAVARVSATGVVTGLTLGDATITAAIDGFEGVSSVEVTRPAVESVIVDPPIVELVVGGSVELEHTVYDVDGNELTDRDVVWASSNTSAATVSPTGVVQAVAEGTATVTATVEGVQGSASFTVVAAIVPVASVTILPNPADVIVGDTTTLTAHLEDADGNTLSGRVIAWSSANASVVTVSAGGRLTGGSIGSTTVIALVEGVADTVTVTVVPVPVASVVVSPSTDSLVVGQEAGLTATTRDGDGNVLTGRPVAWTSNATGVATVSDGIVTAVSPGTATITATSEDKAGSAVITVLSGTSFAGGPFAIDHGGGINIGTVILFDPTNPLDPESPITSVDVSGPSEWNLGAPLNCTPIFTTDDGVAADRAFCLDLELPVVTGDYVGTSALGDTDFSMSTAGSMPAPHIDEILTSGVSVLSVEWTGTGEHASYALQVFDYNTLDLMAHTILDGSARDVILDVDLEPGSDYYLRLVAFDTDVTTGGAPFPTAVVAWGSETYFTTSSENQYWAVGASAIEVRNQPLNTLIGTAPTNGATQRDIVFSDSGDLAYVSNTEAGGTNAVQIYSVGGRTLSDTWELTEAPAEYLAIDSFDYLYATTTNGYVVELFDTGWTGKSIEFAGLDLGGIAVPPAGDEGWVTRSDGQVSVLDLINDPYDLPVTHTIAVGSDPRGIGLTLSHAYVANAGSGTVSVIDQSTKLVATTIPVGAGAVGVAVSPDQSFIYVTNEDSGTVSVIECATWTVVETIPVAANPSSVAFAIDDRLAYVTHTNSPNVSVISTITHEVIDTVTMSGNQLAIAVLDTSGS